MKAGSDLVLGGTSSALALALDAAPPPAGRPRRPMSLIAYGVVSPQLEADLDRHGLHVSRTATPDHFVAALASTDCRAVLVDPDAEDAMGLIRALKLGKPAPTAADALAAAARRHRETPFFIVPVGDDDYAVLVAAPSLAFLGKRTTTPISDAIQRLDVDRMFRCAAS